jgi:hypothetical protein
MPKPIRRSDGHAPKSAGKCADDDDALIERTIQALTGEIKRKQEVINQAPMVRRAGQPTITSSTKELMEESKRVWDQFKKELVDGNNQDHLYDDSDDADIDMNNYTIKE